MFTDLPDTLAYLNGEFTPLNEAKISVLDRGFIFGDGCYEVVPVYQAKLFRLHQHLDRLQRSLSELRIVDPMGREQWIQTIRHLVRAYLDKTQQQNQVVYIQVTRGVAMRDHVMPKGINPTVFMMVNTMKPPPEIQRQQGVYCVSAEDFRWRRQDIKSTSLLGSVFSRQISADQNAVETVMFRNGFLSEAAASNVWVVAGNKVLGPVPDGLVLKGIRYDLLRELCAAEQLEYELRPVKAEEVWQADELLLSSATKEVLPITKLDDRLIGKGAAAGKPGPVYEKLYRAYQQAIRQQSI